MSFFGIASATEVATLLKFCDITLNFSATMLLPFNTHKYIYSHATCRYTYDLLRRQFSYICNGMFHCYYDEILHIYLFFVICKNAQQMWNQCQMSEANCHTGITAVRNFRIQKWDRIAASTISSHQSFRKIHNVIQSLFLGRRHDSD